LSGGGDQSVGVECCLANPCLKADCVLAWGTSWLPPGLKAALVELSLGGGGLLIGRAGLSSSGCDTRTLGEEWCTVLYKILCVVVEQCCT